jgi:hypothetical protein
MARRTEIELTSTRNDGTWTWRAAGAREPRGTVEGTLLPGGAQVGDVLRAELEDFIDGVQVVSVSPPKPSRPEPERIELLGSPAGEPAIRAPRSGSRKDREPRRRRDGRKSRQSHDGAPDTDGGRDGAARAGRSARPRGDRRSGAETQRERQQVEQKPKPRRLRPAKVHRTALLDSLPAEQRPIAEQLLQGGIPAVRQAIQKQNDELRAEGKPEVKADSLLQIAENLRPRVLAAIWRDRADAALARVDDLDLRDLRSIVNAADDATRDPDARAVASQLRDALTARVEKEQAAWIAEIAENINEGRVVRALRLSSRPPKAGSPLPADVANRLVAAAGAALTSDTPPQRWATVLDALAYSPIRRRVVPESLPTQVDPDLRSTIARLTNRLPEMAHIFDISPEEASEADAKGDRRRARGRRGRGSGATASEDASSHADIATDAGSGDAGSGDAGSGAAGSGDDAATGTVAGEGSQPAELDAAGSAGDSSDRSSAATDAGADAGSAEDSAAKVGAMAAEE